MRYLVGQGGYTLVEMLVAISMSTVLTLAIGGFAVNSTLGANQDYNKTLVLSNAKEAVTVVARQVRTAKSVLAANTLPDPHPPVSGNAYSWSGAAGNDTSLILAVPSRNASNDIIFIDGLHTQLYTDEVIFYLDSSTHRLYRRYLANSNAPGNVAKTSCPPALSTSACPADADIVDDVAHLSTTYLDGNSATIINPLGTEAVNYTVTETRTISGRVYSGTYSTIVALRNK